MWNPRSYPFLTNKKSEIAKVFKMGIEEKTQELIKCFMNIIYMCTSQ